ncbi:MAG TPA: DUF3180 domain-containing protein [Nocardioidaceae bacterium]|nr:DUF3180 domain-containing protein [Nocardioidaceae bacterium]
MTRDSQLPREPDGSEEEPQPRGTLQTTGPGLLAGIFLAGIVLGRLVRPVSIELDGTAPRVGWLAVLALFLVAAILAYVAWSTYRTLHREHELLEPSHAVNRLVLAKSCAIVGALLAGGYFGYALSWLGEASELAGERMSRSLLAGVASVLIVAGSLALERACRVRSGPPR